MSELGNYLIGIYFCQEYLGKKIGEGTFGKVRLATHSILNQ